MSLQQPKRGSKRGARVMRALLGFLESVGTAMSLDPTFDSPKGPASLAPFCPVLPPKRHDARPTKSTSIGPAATSSPPCVHTDDIACPRGIACTVFLSDWRIAKVGASLSAGFFSDSPQRFAINNRHLPDYFASRTRAQETTPYEIPASQKHLLAPLGMEDNQPDAPRVPHGLHKSIEEAQLRRLRRILSPNSFGVISVKSTKLHLLPPAASVQNPVFEAKDVSRYPGTAITTASLRAHNTYLMHDVASEVNPHELVEKLVDENPDAQLFVTGLNPVEVLDRAETFEPASHRIEYDGGNFNYIFTDSESEAYSTPVSVTTTWLRTSSVCASNGRVYHVVLLEHKLGHCLWHIFCGDAVEQHTRTFSTGSYIQLPPAITGTLQSEYLPAKVVSGILNFVDYTTDLSPRNLAAKVTQMAGAINPKTSSKERWIARHVAQQRYYKKDIYWWISKGFWSLLYALSFQWQMFRTVPDIYSYLSETKRTRTIHPTPGGGWTPRAKLKRIKRSIPNNPTPLQRASAFTAAVFTYLLPKIALGEILSTVVMHLHVWDFLKLLYQWADLKPLRLILTASVVFVTAIIPGHIVKVFSRISGHFWRQLWLPGWISNLLEIVITELTGGPGHTVLNLLPGRGWFYQAYIWALGLTSILPGLITWLTPHLPGPWILPWVAVHHPVALVVLLSWYALIFLENALAALPDYPLPVLASAPPSFHVRLGVINRCPPSHWHMCLYNTATVFFWHPLRLCCQFGNFLHWHLVRGWVANRGNCSRTPNLAPVSTAPRQTLRQRWVDMPLPAVVVQNARIPNANPQVNLAVDPNGLDFADFLNQVQAAYNQDPNVFPALAPQLSCFWECVASLGGTPHMWYSWFLARMNRVPNPANPADGSVLVSDMHVFAAASRIGVTLGGSLVNQTTPANVGWPTLNLTLSRALLNNMLHVELSNLAAPNVEVGALARIVKTCHLQHANWWNEIMTAFNQAAADSMPVPTPFLLAVAGVHAVPTTRTQVLDALIGSADALPLDPGNLEGFAFDHNQAPTLDMLYTWEAPLQQLRVAGTTSGKMWQTFRGLGKRFRVRNAPDHPLATPMKVGASRSQQHRNATTHNRRPEAPGYVTLARGLADQLARYKDLALPAVQLQAERLTFTADVGRASRVISDLRANPAVLGPFGDSRVIQSLDAIVDTFRQDGKTVTVPLTAYLGVSGCGKTVATAAYLKNLPALERDNARIVSHTEELRAEAKQKLDFEHFRGFNFPTLASIVTEPSTGPVVFDDAGCVWAGLVDLVVLTNPLLTEVVVNGDPAQGLAKFPVRGTQSEHDESIMDTVARQATRYATVSHRLFGLLADTLGVHTTNEVYGHITHSVGPKVGIPTCTASPRYAGVLSSAGRDAYTYDSVQGKDFHTDVEIDATGLEGAILDRTAYVALTRSKAGLYLRLDAANPNNPVRVPPTGSDIINALVYSMRAGGQAHLTQPNWLVKAAFYQHLAQCMPSLPWFCPVGSSVHPGHASLIAPICPDSRPSSLEVDEGAVHQETTTADSYHQHVVPETHWGAKEHREVPGRGGLTDQFKECSFVDPHVHKRNDTATYFLSVDARLKAATRAENVRRFTAEPRKELCATYDNMVPEPPKWTAEKHSQYVDQAWAEYTSKRTEHDVLSKLASHDPTRNGSNIRISLKGQVIKKAEKRAKFDAIPGQLIHEYDIMQTVNDAAFALFLENEIISAFPKRFIFYRRMNPQQFRQEYRSKWKVGNGAYSSDVTRWDVGCDAALLNLDLHIFRRSGLPEEFLNAYFERRVSATSQHGPMATMQNSGDRFTWPINTARRAIVTEYVCDLTDDDVAAVNGDDISVDRFCTAKQLPNSPWIFKDVNAQTVEFSGYELGGPEPHYSSDGLWYRTLILMSRNPTAQDKWVNYMTLLADCDLQHPSTLLVADAARQHMSPELFRQYLPAPLHNHYPDVFGLAGVE
uniref:RNA-dependent RNA polymerase n=2 Tax=Riboviria TaxID=2559587 RepID=A0A8F5RC97_9VIRU|nr:MAG: RNA-dependent RNA polymerase [Grapevine-associated tymo-like virus 1]